MKSKQNSSDLSSSFACKPLLLVSADTFNSRQIYSNQADSPLFDADLKQETNSEIDIVKKSHLKAIIAIIVFLIMLATIITLLVVLDFYILKANAIASLESNQNKTFEEQSFDRLVYDNEEFLNKSNTFNETISVNTTKSSLIIEETLLTHSKRSNNSEKIVLIKQPSFKWDHCGQTHTKPSIETKSLMRRLTKRIVGGEEAVKHSWPFVVSIRIKVNNISEHNCGGTLITDQYVLTAAHCFIPYFRLLSKFNLKLKDIFSLVEVQVGLFKHDEKRLNNQENKSDDTIYAVEYFDIHDNFDFNEWTLVHDIAIIKLKRKVNLNRPEVNIACLPRNDSNYSLVKDDSVVVIGWGAYAEEYEYQSYVKDTLQQGVFKVKDQNDLMCNTGVIGENWDKNYTVCADGKGKPMVTCFGDSGGPVMIYRNKRWTLAGIISFAYDTKDMETNRKKCNASMPFFFVKVKSYIDWIEKKTNFTSTKMNLDIE